MTTLKFDALYRELFATVSESLGSEDSSTVSSLIGFSAGGPVSLSVFRSATQSQFVTYVTCELAAYDEQGTDASPHFELLVSTDEEDFARELLTGLGALSLEASLGHHHTVDVSGIITEDATVAGVVLEEYSRVAVQGEVYAILRVIGLTERELRAARRKGANWILSLLNNKGVYPHTPKQRESAV